MSVVNAYVQTGAGNVVPLVEPAIFRNRIINGDFRIWQRGTSFTKSGDVGPYYTADRWFGSQYGDGVTDELISTDETGGNGIGYQLKFIRVRQYKTSGFSGGNSRLVQILEPSMVQDLRGRSVTLSFYHRVVVAADYYAMSGIWGVYVNYDTNDSTLTSSAATSASIESVGTNILNQTFRTAGLNGDVWIRSSYTFTIPTNAQRVSIVFATNGNTTNGGSLDITGVQLEPGTVATPFEFRPYGTELALCQRYFEKSYSANVAPGTITAVGCETKFSGDTQDFVVSTIPFRVSKRGIPTITAYSPVTGTSGKFRYVDGAADINATTAASEIGENTGYAYSIGLFVANKRYQFHWTASAEL